MSRGRLLVMDDDPEVGRTIGFIAEDAGMEVRWVGTPSDFLRETEAWAPTHIVLDLLMPEMDGVELIGLLAQRGCRARIIISSGVGARVLDAARRSASEHGLDIAGVLPKPFKPAALRDLLRQAPAPAAARHAPTAPAPIDEAALRGALERREFEIAYQPKIRCADYALDGFEALVRWNRPGAGMVMPDYFIPLAETTGLIEPLTEQVFEQAIAWFSAEFPGSTLRLCLNVSARSLGDAGLAERLERLCRAHALHPSRVVLELTETSTMRDPTASLAMLTRLRVKGYDLAIDDFGTGYSSIVQLVRLPFSEIKIDKSFVMTARESEESRSVIRSIIDLGHSLKLRVIAEGVDDGPTLELLRAAGCDLAQGFFISEPMLAAAVPAWVKEWQARKA